MADEIILRERVIVIKAGDTFDQALHGNVLRVTSGSVPLRVQDRDGQLDFTILAGERARFPEESPALILSHTSGVDQTFTIQVGRGVEVASALLSGWVVISGVPNVVVNSVTGVVKTDAQAFSYGGSFKSTTALLANTPQTIISSAANANGIVVHQINAMHHCTGMGMAFIAKTSAAPVNINDGTVIASATSPAVISGLVVEAAITSRAILVPAGQGLYYISNADESSSHRSILYTLL